MRCLALSCVLLVACDDGGYYHPLGDVVAMIEVTHEPTVFVSARFRTSKGQLLPDGVAMTTTYRGMTHDVTCSVMSSDTAEPFTRCALQLGEPSVAGEPLEVALAVNEDIAVSSVTLPPLFAIQSRTGSLQESPITVTWAPTSSAEMSWTYGAQGTSNHTCSVLGMPASGHIEDTGMLVIDTSNAWVQNMGFPCGVWMTLKRAQTGTMAPELSGGSITAVQTKNF